MRKIIVLGLFGITVLFSCTDQQNVSPSTQKPPEKLEIQGRPIRIVTTIGMIADLAKNIGGERVEVTSLMGTGVDPHLYKASAGDVTLISEADLILYNGLHLEAGMSGVLERLSDQKPNQVLAVTKNIDRSKLTAPPEFAGAYDPHVWFDVTLWKDVAETIHNALVLLMPSAEAHFESLAKKYILQLEALHIYVQEKAAQIEPSKRVLVTAHDAFGTLVRPTNSRSTASKESALQPKQEPQTLENSHNLSLIEKSRLSLSSHPYRDRVSKQSKQQYKLVGLKYK